MSTCTRLQHIANAHVIDELGVNARLCHYCLEDWSEHCLGRGIFLCTLLGLCHGSSGVGKDNDIIVSLGTDTSSIEGLVVANMVVENLESPGSSRFHCSNLVF